MSKEVYLLKFLIKWLMFLSTEKFHFVPECGGSGVGISHPSRGGVGYLLRVGEGGSHLLPQTARAIMLGSGEVVLGERAQEGRGREGFTPDGL